MASHELLAMYYSLNAAYDGELPSLDPDVKCVQCDGCDRVITFAVFHSAFGGGVDVCNICRVAAAQSAEGAIASADGKSHISFAAHPLCFVAAAPLPPGYAVDSDEVEVERRPALVARRFAKSVDVIPRAPPTRKGRGSVGAAAARKRLRPAAHSPGTAPRPARPTPRAKTPPPARARTRAKVDAEPGRSTLSFSSEFTPPPTPTATPGPNAQDSLADHSTEENGATSEMDAAARLQARQQKALDCAVARSMRPLRPGTRPVAERPATVARPPLAAFDHDAVREFVVAPDGFCRTTRGIVALSPCVAVRAARIVPTLPSVGLWVAVLCEEECHARLDIWECGGSAPARRYSVLVGRHAVSAMDWLPVPLHRADNDVLGLCTLVRGRYIISAVLPRLAPGTADVDSGACVSAEICGAALLRRDVELADVRWSTSGASFAETFLFAVGRCTSVIVLQPTGDTQAGHLTLHVLHCIDAHGVPRAPLCVRAPPIALCAPPGARMTVAVAHSASAAVFQAPEFSTRLFVALDDAACALHLRGRAVIAGLEHGAIVNATTGTTIARLGSAPLVIAASEAGKANAAGDGGGLLVADAAGDCVRLSGEGAATPLAALRRLRRGGKMRASVVVGARLDPALRGDGDEATAPHFALHPLREVLGVEGPGPMLAYYPDGAWVLIQWEGLCEA